MATHLKSLAKKANLNEGHAKAARVYKARVASLTSERAKLRDKVQSMTEEAVKLKSDLKHTTEGREDEARNSLRAAEVELREVWMSYEMYKMTCWRPGMSCNLPSLSFRWSGMSFLRPRASCEGLKKSCVRLETSCAIRQRC